MEENHQDNAENKLKSTGNKPLLLVFRLEDEKEAANKWTWGFSDKIFERRGE